MNSNMGVIDAGGNRKGSGSQWEESVWRRGGPTPRSRIAARVWRSGVALEAKEGIIAMQRKGAREAKERHWSATRRTTTIQRRDKVVTIMELAKGVI